MSKSSSCSLFLKTSIRGFPSILSMMIFDSSISTSQIAGTGAPLRANQIVNLISLVILFLVRLESKSGCLQPRGLRFFRTAGLPCQVPEMTSASAPRWSLSPSDHACIVYPQKCMVQKGVPVGSNEARG